MSNCPRCRRPLTGFCTHCAYDELAHLRASPVMFPWYLFLVVGLVVAGLSLAGGTTSSGVRLPDPVTTRSWIDFLWGFEFVRALVLLMVASFAAALIMRLLRLAGWFPRK